MESVLVYGATTLTSTLEKRLDGHVLACSVLRSTKISTLISQVYQTIYGNNVYVLQAIVVEAKMS